jgi:hypothetical protein
VKAVPGLGLVAAAEGEVEQTVQADGRMHKRMAQRVTCQVRDLWAVGVVPLGPIGRQARVAVADQHLCRQRLMAQGGAYRMRDLP